MKRKTLALVAVSLALGLGAAAGAARSGLLGELVIGGKGHAAASGIQVHGKWTLVVRNKHGKVVARRRFENSLTSDGATVLRALLLGGLYCTIGSVDCGGPGGRDEVGGIAIDLGDGSTVGHGCNVVAVVHPCTLFRTFDVSPGHDGSGPLGITASNGGFTLSGLVTPLAPTTFTSVSTLVKMCYSWHESAHDCGSETDSFWAETYTFTSKTIQPLSVQAGQTLTASVALSFS